MGVPYHFFRSFACLLAVSSSPMMVFNVAQKKQWNLCGIRIRILSNKQSTFQKISSSTVHYHFHMHLKTAPVFSPRLLSTPE